MQSSWDGGNGCVEESERELVWDPASPHAPSATQHLYPVSPCLNLSAPPGLCHCLYDCVTVCPGGLDVAPALSESLYEGVGSLLTLHPSTPTFLPLPVLRLICVSFPSLAGDIGLPEAHMRWELAAAGQQGLHTAPA